MSTCEEIRFLHSAIDALSEGRNLSKVEVEAVLSTLKRAEKVIYPSPEDLMDYYVKTIELNCINPERFPDVYRDSEAELIAFEKKYELEIDN